MDIFKKFFDKKKADKRFKKAGPGHKLDDDAAETSRRAPPTQQQKAAPVTQQRLDDAEKRAQAALARLNMPQTQASRSKQAVRAQVQKEIDEERRRQQTSSEKAAAATQQVRDEDCAPVLAISGVFFTCDLLGDDVVLEKPALKRRLEEFLQDEMDENALVASTLIIFTLNNAEVRQAAVDILKRYLDNLLNEPDSAKFRRIRAQNKAFKERIIPARGACEFLRAIGFEETLLPATEGGAPESHFEIPADRAADAGALVQARQLLEEGQPVPLKLHRMPTVYQLNPERPGAELKTPPDFFALSADELRRAQKDRTDAVDKMLTLRTRAMRDRDEKHQLHRYRYCLVRVVFADGFLLQGTFGTAEPFSSVREFVRRHTEAETATFGLTWAGGEAIGAEVDASAIGELGLAPAALLRFVSTTDTTYLKPRLLADAQSLP